MAMAVARALQKGEHLAVEAGAGWIAKSLAYLIPAILYAKANRKGDHFHSHHKPAGAAHRKRSAYAGAGLPVPFPFTMLKGRSNYLCTRRLNKAALQSASLFTNSETQN